MKAVGVFVWVHQFQHLVGVDAEWERQLNDVAGDIFGIVEVFDGGFDVLG